MDPDAKTPTLTEEQSRIFRELARAKSDSDQAEAALIRKYSSRVVALKQVWAIASACVVAIIFGTSYVLNMQRSVEATKAEVSSLREEGEVDIKRVDAEVVALRMEVGALRDKLTDLRLDMKDKQDRNRP